MGGDDLASDDEYLFDTGSPRGTAISSDDENGNNSSDDDDDNNNNNNNIPTSQNSKKRKGSELTNTETTTTGSSKKKRKKKKTVPTNSKNILIHAGRGIAMDGVEAQAMFLGTIYTHSLKMMESGVGGGNNNNNANNNDDDGKDGKEGEEGGKKDNAQEETNQSTTTPFSFQPHLYTPPPTLNTKIRTYHHTNLAAFLKSGPLPSTKRLKNWKHPQSPMVLIVTLSARRSVELMKQLSSLKLPVAKLFAKHMSLEDQVELLRGGVKNKSGGGDGGGGGGGGGGGKKRARCYSLAVGTPGRLLKLLRYGRDEEEENVGGNTNNNNGGGGGALRLKHTELVIFDCHEDSKGWTVCTLKDTSRELMEFTKEGVVGELEKRKGKIKLAMF